jgi:hypothetical protein
MGGSAFAEVEVGVARFGNYSAESEDRRGTEEEGTSWATSS